MESANGLTKVHKEGFSTPLKKSSDVAAPIPPALNKIGHAHGDVLPIGQPTGVSDRDLQLVVVVRVAICRRLEIGGTAESQHAGSGIEVKQAIVHATAGDGGQAVSQPSPFGVGVIGLHVGHGGLILGRIHAGRCTTTITADCLRTVFTDVGDRNTDILPIGQATRVGDRHLHFVDVVRVGIGWCLEIGGTAESQQAGSGVEGEQAIVHAAAGDCRQAVSQSRALGVAVIARIDVGHGGLILGRVHAGRCTTTMTLLSGHILTDVGDGNRDVLPIGQSTRVGDRDLQLVVVVRVGIGRRLEIGCTGESQCAGVGVEGKQAIVHPAARDSRQAVISPRPRRRCRRSN